MPTITTRRKDILRPKEIVNTTKTARAKGLDWLACMISIVCIFGKRINEVVSLTREQIFWDAKFLSIRFIVSKKRTSTPIPIYYTKRKTMEHPLIPYIIEYVSKFKEGYIFPFNRKEEHLKQQRLIKRKDGTQKLCIYEYVVEGGHISRNLALYYLKKIAPNWWWHLGRESLATRMAEDGASEEELMHWFDWDTVDSAHKYVKRGTKLTEKWSERTW